MGSCQALSGWPSVFLLGLGALQVPSPVSLSQSVLSLEGAEGLSEGT